MPATSGEVRGHKYDPVAPSEDEIHPQRPEEGRPIGNIDENTQALIEEQARKAKRSRILKIVSAIMIAIVILLITSWAT